MRFFASAFILSTLALLVNGAANAVPSRQFPDLRQVTRRDLEIRAKYPDLFRRQSTTTNGPDPLCPGLTKRDNVGEQLLNSTEAAAFLRGRGTFTSSNGTTYYDGYFVRTMEREAAKIKARHWLHTVVRNSLGTRLLEVSLPFYKAWKDRQESDPEQIVRLSHQTAIRAKDLRGLGEALLADPDFEDVQIIGYRVNRRFLEAVHEYLY